MADPSTRGSLFKTADAPAASDDSAVATELRSQGLEETEFNLARVRQGLKEGKPAREVVPDFARSWPGRGRVTLNTLGPVNDYNELIERYALSYGIDPNLIAAQMYCESAGDHRAESQAGAQGLMQFMPDTARRFGITDPYDPEQSIRGACRYMRWLLDRYDGSVPQALGGYNSGEGNADKNRIPRETKNYVPMIINLWMSAGADNE